MIQQLKRRQVRQAIADVLRTAVEALLLFLIFSALVGRFEIHQISMEPTFHEGQRVVVSRLESLWPTWLVGTAHAADRSRNSPFALHRGQIAVFYNSTKHEGTPLIKRVIGVPGDTVELRDGAVVVNGTVLNEPYVHGQPTTCYNTCESITLAADMYFMLGDNRPNSMDSRIFGPVHADQIVGRVVLRYWPLNQAALYL